MQNKNDNTLIEYLKRLMADVIKRNSAYYKLRESEKYEVGADGYVYNV